MEFMKKVEEISRKVGKTASDTYNTVADKSGKIIEETKLKVAINDKETDIEEIYVAIGKTVYEMYKDGEDVGKVFTKEAKKVDKIKSEIEDMNNKILYNKGLRVCQECGEVVSIDSEYCSMCGKNLKKLKLNEEKKDEKAKKEEKKELKEQVCPQCGVINDGKAKFCSKCGYQFSK